MMKALHMRGIVVLLTLSGVMLVCGLVSAAADSRKVDEYGNISCEDEVQRLNYYAIELQKMPGVGRLVANLKAERFGTESRGR